MVDEDDVVKMATNLLIYLGNLQNAKISVRHCDLPDTKYGQPSPTPTMEILQNFVAFSEFMNFTGKSMSEALILASINAKYDDRLFVELRVQENYKFSTCCVHQIVLTAKTKQNN